MTAQRKTLQDHITEYMQTFRKPAHELDVSFARWIIFGFFIYKLLSRDFTTFAYMPDFLMHCYPASVYNPNYYALMGTQFITDLASFHWIHWVLPFPGAQGMAFLQWLAIILCAMTCLLGRGPSNLLAITTYVLISYLWGYMWRNCNDIDAAFLALGCMFVYCFSKHREHLLIWRWGFGAKATSEAGWTTQAFLMVFVIYYFASGMNKLIDISLVDWFRFDMVQILEYERDRYILGYYKLIPPIFDIFRGQYWLNYIGVPMVYLSHLFIPMIFYDRSRIPYFWYFYALFHFMSWGVGILFTGNFIMWFVFFPLSRFFCKSYFEYSPASRPDRWMATGMRLLNWTGRLKLTRRDDAYPPQIRQSWEAGHRTGLNAWRRACWNLPLFWPLLPLLYLPGTNQLNSLLYRSTRKVKRVTPMPTSSPSPQSLTSLAQLRESRANILLYDGSCPFCDQYVRLLRLKQAVGDVTLMNAREQPALVQDLAANGIDINKGMLWSESGTIYYDHEAINRLALLCEDDDGVNTLNHLLFANARVSQYLYPVLKLGRRLTLKLLRRKPISLHG